MSTFCSIHKCASKACVVEREKNEKKKSLIEKHRDGNKKRKIKKKLIEQQPNAPKKHINNS